MDTPGIHYILVSISCLYISIYSSFYISSAFFFIFKAASLIGKQPILVASHVQQLAVLVIQNCHFICGLIKFFYQETRPVVQSTDQQLSIVIWQEAASPSRHVTPGGTMCK